MTWLLLVMTYSLMTSVLSQIVPGGLPVVPGGGIPITCQKFRDYCNGRGGWPQCCPGLACVNERCTGPFTGGFGIGISGGLNTGTFGGFGGLGPFQNTFECTRQGDECGRRGPCCPGTVCVPALGVGGLGGLGGLGGVGGLGGFGGFGSSFFGGFNSGFGTRGYCTSVGNLNFGFGGLGGIATGPFLDEPTADQPAADNSTAATA